MKEDKKYMRMALKLAAKGTPSPNPYVGAVIVKQGKVIGKGWHRKAGMPHAEVEALNSLQDAGEARGATMYVSLEPCNHHGRTPPCTQALLKAGIAKVVFALCDPNPVADGGEEELRKNGVQVEKGVLEGEAGRQNEIFLKFVKKGRPFVLLKAAESLDGKIASKSGESKWITGEKARKYAHKLRSSYDAVLVGANTVLADNPQLTARIRGGRNPLRVVLDSALKIPLESNVLKDSNFAVAVTGKADGQKISAMEAKGGKVLFCGDGERVDLQLLLEKLAKLGVTSVLVEGGGEVHASFVEQRLFDKVAFFIAPKIVGGREAKTSVEGQGVQSIADATKVEISSVKRLGEDLVVEAYPAKGISLK